ncbi:MAG TPA: sensor domain-containing protein [Solirubrobacteraceae bacterium]|nr:sensor domain-containing protein [Solirubrobacteraceae bacterium]
MPSIDAISSCGPSIRPAPRYRTRVLSTAGRDLLYVLAVLPLSIAGFAIWVTGVSVTLSLAVLVVGALAWLGTVALVRLAADCDRRLAGWYRGARIDPGYQPTRSSELGSTLRTVTRDPQTWRDLGWVVGNSTIGFVVATAAVTLTGLVLGLITTPAWWWAIPHPSQEYATLNLGIYTVTSTGLAFVNTALGLVLLPVAAAVNHWVAAGHSRLAARFLGAR